MINQIVITKIQRSFGITYEVANEGKQALDKYKKKKFNKYKKKKRNFIEFKDIGESEDGQEELDENGEVREVQEENETRK